MEYRVLGPLEVRRGEESLPLAGAKQRALLALLLVHANHVLSRDRLIDELWGSEPPETAVQSLQVYVSRLRKLLPANTLLTRPPGYLLEVAPDELDVQRFERLLAAGREALAQRESESASGLLHDALALWRGPALAEFAFEPFAQAEIGRLEDLRLAAVEERIEADLALGRHADLIGELEALVTESPYRERLRGQLMLALYRSGRQAEALDAYRNARHALVDELGIEPSGALQRLEKAILNQDEGLETQTVSTTQLERKRHQADLPVPATPFVGREAELAEVVELLTREEVQLLTLTGPGGTGKTRLALQAAAESAQAFADGVWWVPLAPLRDPALVLLTVAGVLGVREEPGSALGQTLARELGGKRLLVLLDNAEHLLPDLAESIATLRDLDGSTVLVTSRERLRLEGEHIYPVASLEERDGVALLVARARALDPAFAWTPVVDELCRRLDQLPLAIELAAARTTLFPPEQLLDRLDQRLDLLRGGRDADQRQQTLRATMEWSHELLTDGEQTLFRRLAVFVGGCTYHASETVCEAGPDTLQSLLDKSLLRRRSGPDGKPRFGMLETIREFALERLDASREADQLRSKHSEYFLAASAEIFELARGPRIRDAQRRGAVEMGNTRAALSYLLERDVTRTLELLVSTGFQWEEYPLEGVHWFEEALARADHVDEYLRARACYNLGFLYWHSLGDPAKGTEAFQRSLPALRAQGTPFEVAYLLMHLGRHAEALRLMRRHRDPDGYGMALHTLGELARAAGNPARGRVLIAEGLDYYRRHDQLRQIPPALHGMADCALDEGKAQEARDGYRESLELGGQAVGMILCLAGLAAAASLLGCAEQSGCLWGAAGAMRREYPELVPEAHWTYYESRLSGVSGSQEFLDGFAVGEQMTESEAVEYALSLD